LNRLGASESIGPTIPCGGISGNYYGYLIRAGSY
jgi:hypothetical protein